MQMLISRVRSYFVYRQVATSRIFAWVSSCDERIGIVDFLKEVCYHVEFQFLKSVSSGSNMNVYISTRYVNVSLSFLFKYPLCHRVKDFAASFLIFHLLVSDFCKLPRVWIVAFKLKDTTCRIKGQKVSVPTFLPCDSRFKYGIFSVHLTLMQYFLAFSHDFSVLC